MKILIDEKEKLYLTSDANNWIIATMKPIKDKKTGAVTDTLTPMTFHTTAGSAFKSYVERKAKRSNATTFKGLVDDVNAAVRNVRAIAAMVDEVRL